MSCHCAADQCGFCFRAWSKNSFFLVFSTRKWPQNSPYQLYCFFRTHNHRVRCWLMQHLFCTLCKSHMMIQQNTYAIKLAALQYTVSLFCCVGITLHFVMFFVKLGESMGSQIYDKMVVDLSSILIMFYWMKSCFIQHILGKNCFGKYTPMHLLWVGFFSLWFLVRCLRTLGVLQET